MTGAKQGRLQPLVVVMVDAGRGHRVMVERVWPHARAGLERGRMVRVTVEDADDHVQVSQRNYLHGVVLRTIAAQVRPGGRHYPMEVWKEYFRDLFLGERVAMVPDPMTGRMVRRVQRVGSEDLGVRAYAEYTEKVMAWAAQEHGVAFPGMGETIDPETGEILGG